jgi:hypothetical protein
MHKSASSRNAWNHNVSLYENIPLPSACQVVKKIRDPPNAIGFLLESAKRSLDASYPAGLAA